jgi:hypothetical protein
MGLDQGEAFHKTFAHPLVMSEMFNLAGRGMI